MDLKYKALFEELSIEAVCPPINLQQIDIDAFRWILDPVTHDLNFLPNYAFDKEKGNIGIYANGFLNADRKCLRCSMSLYTTVEAAKINYKKLSKQAKKNLGYTHIAKGKIDPTDGACTTINDVGHFSFFEFANCDLKAKFIICDSLEN